MNDGDRALQTALSRFDQAATELGIEKIEADTALRAEIEARSHKPDVLLIDLGLPDGDGLTVIRRVRTWSPVPIVVLSARTMEEQKVAALDAGADDYVTKPFSAPELLARLRAALRRHVSGAAPTSLLKFAAVQVALARREARGPEGELHLTPLEYRVLATLARHLGSIVTQRQLIRGAGHDAGSFCRVLTMPPIRPRPTMTRAPAMIHT